MSINGTFGDELTLRAAAESFNIKFFIISTLGRAAEAVVTPQNFARKAAFIWDTLQECMMENKEINVLI